MNQTKEFEPATAKIDVEKFNLAKYKRGEQTSLSSYLERI